MSDTLTAGSTYRFQATVYENEGDASPLDLTGASVYLKLRKPDGTVVTKTATVVDAANGLARYDSQTTDLPAADAGPWRRSWRVVNATVDITSRATSFMVEQSPG